MTKKHREEVKQRINEEPMDQRIQQREDQKEEKRLIQIEEIEAVMDYHDPRGRTGGFYVGGIMSARVCRLLHRKYGDPNPKTTFKEDLLASKYYVVQGIHSELGHYIRYMKKNPMKKCSCCGSTVPADV